MLGAIGTLVTSTSQGEIGEWFAASWGFAKQILPLLLVGILLPGLRRDQRRGILPLFGDLE